MEGKYYSLLAYHKENSSRDLKAQIEEARAELILCLTSAAERSIRWSKFTFFSQSDMDGTLLAQRLTPRPQSFSIPKVQKSDGRLTQQPKEVLDIFAYFYKELYGQEPPCQSADLLFADMQLPMLSEMHRELVDAPFTPIEVMKAIKSLKPSKCLGPDGFSNFYYKQYADLLVPHLVQYFNSIREGLLPFPEALAAHISLMPKPGKDHTKCQN